MGNSTSRLGDDIHTGRKASRRRSDATATSRNDSYLNVPSQGHHRSRSTNDMPSQEHLPPPPSYTVAVNTPPVVPPRTSVAAGTANAGPQERQNPFRNMSVNSRNAYLRAPIRRGTAEDVLETLRKFNTVFIVDDSSSMEGRRWREAREALASLADIAAKYDTDGIDVYFLNNTSVGTGMNSSAAVRRLFDDVRPRGITPIGEKLEELLLEYLCQLDDARNSGNPAAWKAIKPVNYIVITDGAPTDDPESVIVAAARRLDARNYPMAQVGIQFVQVGDAPEATKYLNELDDELASNYGIRDIVDTTPYIGGELTADVLTKILIGGINRRVDVKGVESVL